MLHPKRVGLVRKASQALLRARCEPPPTTRGVTSTTRPGGDGVIGLPPPGMPGSFASAARAFGDAEREGSTSARASSRPSVIGAEFVAANPSGKDKDAKAEARRSVKHSPSTAGAFFGPTSRPSSDREREAVDAEAAVDPDAMAVTIPSLTLPQPSMMSMRPTRHPFNTHAFVSALEKANVSPDEAKTLMDGVRELLTARMGRAAESTLSREELENEVYLFKAAVSKLHTEFNVRNKHTGIAMRDAVTSARRQIDSVEQTLADQMQVLKHDIELDMNNRKVDTRTDMKAFDIGIQEINNRATILLGDLKTEIESAKWEATRRAISIIVVLVLCGVGISSFTIPDSTKVDPAPAPASPAPPPATRDIGIGPDEVPFDYEARIEKILSSVPTEKREKREKRERRPSKPEVFVDRI